MTTKVTAMDIMVPEILCIICSFLNIDDVRRFRLCCRAFADAAACFVHREIVFYLHHDDFEMLRRISLHPIASRNVRSLVYIGHTLGQPKQSMEEFRRSYASIRDVEEITARHMKEPVPPQKTEEELIEHYKNYEATLDQEERIIRNDEDFSLLKEVISRFTSLQEITLSCDFWFRRGSVKTPFQDCLVKPGDELQPVGCRQLDSLLSAIFETEIKLKKLTAGELNWRFFQKPPAELRRAIPFYSNLTCLELCIETGMEEIEEPGMREIKTGTEIPQCRRLLETGLLRDFIKSLTQLQTLYIVFDFHSDEHGYAAKLENIMEPKHRWEYLDSLTLGNISCERHDLLSMLKRHKSTLKELCLRDIQLRSTSWQVLLPKIRRTMDLDDACICGELYGQEETAPFYEEYWDLGVPEAIDDPLRADVSDYLVNNNIRRCPLTTYNNSV
ncbi:hypothetical protein F4776DRAFT_132516 [Hypoxylon sp. NC0597]|nr:hypothetical protein F4776DRAFT_132516 [Hypoxylon sp. NC0597]